MMRIPECFEALLANLGVGSRIYEQHAQQHDVTRHAASLCIMNLDCRLRTDVTPLHVEEVDIMRCHMHHCPEEHRVCNLAMEPLALIEW